MEIYRLTSTPCKIGTNINGKNNICYLDCEWSMFGQHACVDL